MRVSEDEMDDSESEDEEFQEKNYVAVKRFHCDELDLRHAINYPVIVFCYSLFPN